MDKQKFHGIEWKWSFLMGFLLIIVIFSQNIRSSAASENQMAYPAPGTSWLGGRDQFDRSACDRIYSLSLLLPSDKVKLMNEQQYLNCLQALFIPPEKQEKIIETQLPTSVVKEMRPRRVAGSGIIIYGIISRISPTVFFQTNSWYEKKDDQYIYVFAGANRSISDPQDYLEGVLIIEVLNSNRETMTGGGKYPTPNRVGPVTIIDAVGEKIILTSQDGNILFFDVPSRKFTLPDGGETSGSVVRQTENGFIVEDGRSPLVDQKYKVLNRWFREINGKVITIFAGLEIGSNERGVIVVYESEGEPTLLDNPRIFYSRSPSSAFRIFDAKKDHLLLVNSRGEIYTFSLNAYIMDGPIVTFIPEDSTLATLEAPLPKKPQPTITRMQKPLVTPTSVSQRSYP